MSPRGRTAAALVVAVLACPAAAAADDAPLPPSSAEPALNLADLAAYRAALDGKPGGEAAAVTFRELWDHPDRYRGHRVRVEGRVARRFRQGAFGTFPPLAEVWVVGPAGDPVCVVFPDPGKAAAGVDPKADPAPGASVRFEGVFLRPIRYQGGDAARVAPLVVGDRPPAVTEAAPRPPAPGADTGAWGGFSGRDWLLGLAALTAVALVLARQHVRGAGRRPLRGDPAREPPPEFLGPPYNEGGDAEG